MKTIRIQGADFFRKEKAVMSEEGLETIESTTQKAHEWIARIGETLHMEKREAWKSLRAVLQTTRDRLPVNDAVHFGAQLPMLIRGMYYEGWQPSQVPVKLMLREFLDTILEEIVVDRTIDPIETTRAVFAIVGSYIGLGEMEKVKQIFPRDMQNLFPAVAEAA